MKQIIMILVVLMVASSCFAQSYRLASFSSDELNYYQGIRQEKEEWDTRDTFLELGFLTIAGIDLWQTYTFLHKNPDGSTEANSILSSRPSKQRLFITAGIWGTSHFLISYILPTHWLRNIWQVVGIFSHLECVMRNYMLGVRLSF
jgi:hypothetical protein